MGATNGGCLVGWDEGDDDWNDDGFFDPEDECGRGSQQDIKKAWADCSLAGTEFCDFECPFAARYRASRPLTPGPRP